MEHKVDMTDYSEDLINALTVEKILSYLTSEERDLITLWMSNSFTLEEIGRIVGQKYHQEDLKASKVLYHKGKILEKLRNRFNHRT